MINELNEAEAKFALEHPIIYHLGGLCVFAAFLIVIMVCIVLFGGN